MKFPFTILIAFAAPLLAEVKIARVDAMTRVMRVQETNDMDAAIEAARGEWESLQVVLTATPGEIKGITLEVTALQGPDSTSIPAPEVLREHYVKVAKSTPMSPLPAGDYPDALVPQDFPWQVLPDGKEINQPWWIDVHVPYGTKAGLYAGEVVAKNTQGTDVARTKLLLRVSDFDLPVVPRLKSSMMTGYRRMLEVHGFDPDKDPPTAAGVALVEQYYDFMVKHRLAFDQSRQTYPNPGTGKLNAERVEKAMRQHLLHRHAGMIGLPLWPTWPFGDSLGKDRAAAMRYCADWMKLLHKAKVGERGYIILAELDEPNSADAYSLVRRWGDFFNEAEAMHGVRLPLLVTEQPTADSGWWGTLDGFVDIWSPHVSSVWQDMESPKGNRDIARRLKAGDEVWCYTALVQTPQAWLDAHGRPAVLKESNPPVWCLDFPSMNHRIMAWVMPRHGITGFTYWDTLHSAKGVDVWESSDSFHTTDGSEVFHGDGSFIYPATKKRHGRDMPVASIRLKWLREMCDDYDYLMLARDLSLEKPALKLAESFARGFGDWNDDMAQLYAARRAIAALIVQNPAKLGGAR
jgi:hypothetical protein